jgi:ABC-type uncharacterized transport system ATPase subunit
MHVLLKNIQKSFGSIHANDCVTMGISPGVILGLLGENGAGKSTLMKILSGQIPKDSGEIMVDNQLVDIKDPLDALEHGIGMLHQDPHDFPSMRIKDNLCVTTVKSQLASREKWKSLAKFQEKLGFGINFDGYVGELTVGERQQLEMLRLLYMGIELLILDEPTTGISASQKELLFSALKKIAREGKSIIFVSHKLEEIQELCTHAAIMRKGRLVGELNTPFNQEMMIELMFGRKISRISPCRSSLDENLLTLRDLSVDDFRLRISGINLDLQKGEVIGLAGMEGSGQRQFLQALAGMRTPIKGEIKYMDRDITGNNCYQYQNEGIHFVPSSRLEEGLFPGMTLAEHHYLADSQINFFVNESDNQAISLKKINYFQIVGTPSSLVEQLSGGNQQRMLLSLQSETSQLLLLENPTRGLDIESSNWIWKILRERCQYGTSIIFSSSDLDELLFYADRIMVFYNGMATDAIPVNELDEEKMGAMIGGVGWSAW